MPLCDAACTQVQFASFTILSMLESYVGTKEVIAVDRLQYNRALELDG